MVPRRPAAPPVQGVAGSGSLAPNPAIAAASGAVAIPRWLLGGAAWAASTVLTAYGGLLVGVGALVLTGLVSPSGPVDRPALRWHVLLWDLWFLVWGLLLGVAAWHYGRASGSRGVR